jgi:hypothetical protein
VFCLNFFARERFKFEQIHYYENKTSAFYFGNPFFPGWLCTSGHAVPGRKRELSSLQASEIGHLSAK